MSQPSGNARKSATLVGVITMAVEELRALEGLLARMRALYDEMDAYHGGISLLHLEAAVASLETHLDRHAQAGESRRTSEVA
jgi:hypothetical protein